MQAKSWAQIAALPERRAATKTQESTPATPVAVEDDASSQDAGLGEWPPSPGIEVTGAQLEAGVKFSWSINPAHLLDDSSPSASEDEEVVNKMDVVAEKTGDPLKMPTLSFSPVITIFSSVDDTTDSLITGSENHSGSQNPQFCSATANMSEEPDTPTKLAPNNSDQFNDNTATTPLLPASGIQADQQLRTSDNNSTENGALEMNQLDGPIQSIQASIESSPTKSTHDLSNTPPASPCKSIASSAPSQNPLVADKIEYKPVSPDTMKASKTAQLDDTLDTAQSHGIARESLFISDATNKEGPTIKNAEITKSSEASSPLNIDPDLKGKGKEKQAVTTGHQFTGPPHTRPARLDLSQKSKKTITPREFIAEDPEKTPTNPVRAQDLLRQPMTSSSSVAGPSSQNIVSRVGTTTYSAVPDDDQDWPHTSGLDYEERCAVLRSYVEAMEDLKRARELMKADPDCTDVIIFTKHPVTGTSERSYHREVILKDSEYMARIMPPPNDDGSPITMYMGAWPITMLEMVFDFMYNHKTPGCEPPADDLFYHMSSAWLNYHCYLLACAFECKRQKGYNTRNLRKIVELAEKQTSGNYAGYQLAYWEFSQCEEALRDLVRTAFKETGHQEAQRPMRVLVARLTAAMVPWILRGKYMGPIMVPLWFEMKEEYLPWREMLWHFIATGEVQSTSWTWLGEPMSELQITTALSRFGAGF